MNVVDSSGWLEYLADAPGADFFAPHRLPLADSIVLATARAHGAMVWTQDSDFEGLPDVQYTPKKKP
jgi:predicted nucleic acid-binding protein